MSETISLAELKEHPIYRNLLIASLDDFIDCINNDLDIAALELENNRANTYKLDEDTLTIMLLMYMRGKGYKASHDTKIGGHTDIFISHRKGFQWCAESKIHRDYSWLEKGFKQLTTRYLAGTKHSCHGCMIIFVKNKNALGIKQKWQDRLHNNLQCDTMVYPNDPEFSFVSENLHSSGMKLKIRHKIINLHFNPEDKK